MQVSIFSLSFFFFCQGTATFRRLSFDSECNRLFSENSRAEEPLIGNSTFVQRRTACKFQSFLFLLFFFCQGTATFLRLDYESSMDVPANVRTARTVRTCTLVTRKTEDVPSLFACSFFFFFSWPMNGHVVFAYPTMYSPGAYSTHVCAQTLSLSITLQS